MEFEHMEPHQLAQRIDIFHANGLDEKPHSGQGAHQRRRSDGKVKHGPSTMLLQVNKPYANTQAGQLVSCETVSS